METNNRPRVLLKSKNIQILMEYCIESKLEFTVIPRKMNDEWEIEINITDITKAVELGMFMRTNKLELAGNEFMMKPKVVVKPVRKPSEKETTLTEKESHTEHEGATAEVHAQQKAQAAKIEPGLGLDFFEEEK